MSAGSVERVAEPAPEQYGAAAIWKGRLRALDALLKQEDRERRGKRQKRGDA
jgi:hypothetical protein